MPRTFTAISIKQEIGFEAFHCFVWEEERMISFESEANLNLKRFAYQNIASFSDEEERVLYPEWDGIDLKDSDIGSLKLDFRFTFEKGEMKYQFAYIERLECRTSTHFSMKKGLRGPDIKGMPWDTEVKIARAVEAELRRNMGELLSPEFSFHYHPKGWNWRKSDDVNTTNHRWFGKNWKSAKELASAE